MPIQIIDGFKLGASKPIDDRIVASGSTARFAIPNKYDGLLVVDTKDRKPYIWNADSGTWSSISSGSNGVSGSVTTSTNNTYVGNTDNVYIGGNSTTKNVYIGDTNNKSDLNVSNNLNVTGLISGDGSKITNINPSNISGGTIDQVLQIKQTSGKLTPTWSTISTGGNTIAIKSTVDSSNYFIGFINSISGAVSDIYNKQGVGIQNNVLYLNGVGLSASNTLTVGGNSTLNGTLTVASGKTTTLGGNTSITGASTFTVGTGATTLGGTLTVASGKTTTLGGNTSITGASTFTVGTGATTLGGTLTVASGKTTTLGGNTSITGASTFTVGTGTTTLGGALTVTGNSTLNGNTSITGASTFTVGTGTTTLGGALTVAPGKTTTLGGTLTVTGNSTLNGNTSITGASTFTVGTGTTTLGGNLTVANGKTITLSGTTIKALSNTNEFNFINDSGYNNDLYLNYRGVSSVNSYIFWNGKASSGTYAPIYTGGSYNNGPVNIGLNGTIIQRVVVGSVNVAQNGTHAINKGSNFVVMGSGSTSGNVPVAVINLKKAMPNTNYSIFVSFSNSVNAYQWVCVSEVVNTSTFKISVARTNASSWSGVLEVSFMVVCYSN